ncbi:MAG TPA: exonuclease domain-containing protein, partial [Solirubrobacterales bacterium]
WEPGEVWCTLLRPERDLGPTDIHGIRGRDLRDAPGFEDVLGEVLDRLAGRVLVAHNARFDVTFLEHELLRMGIDVAPLPTLCTMELARAAGIGGGRRRLADCCAAIGAASTDSHTARGDALACAALLAAWSGANGGIDAGEAIHGSPTPRERWPRSENRAPCRTRATAGGTTKEPDFLARLVESMEAPSGIDASQVAPYLDVLDRAIEDRRLSPDEQDELAETATSLGLGADRVRKLHADYVATLVALARRDGVVTERERADLNLVGEALGIGSIGELLDRPPQETAANPAEIGGVAGKSVCFTGALICHHEGQLVTRELAHELAEQAGMVVAPRVTKKLDMLVVADPDSLSGKARKAREYGVRIVAETAFWSMIGIEVS